MGKSNITSSSTKPTTTTESTTAITTTESTTITITENTTTRAKSTASASKTPSVIHIVKPEVKLPSDFHILGQTEEPDDKDETSSRKASSQTPSATSKTHAKSPTTTSRILVVPTVITIKNETNSTKTPESSKSSLPIILGSAFGGVAIIVLIVSIVIYVLIKQGYIKIFNQPGIRIKNIERSRIVESSSSIGGASPSRR